jgi:hypothetical protein
VINENKNVNKINVTSSTMQLWFVTAETKIEQERETAHPLQAWTGPEGSRRSRLSDFKIIGT